VAFRVHIARLVPACALLVACGSPARPMSTASQPTSQQAGRAPPRCRRERAAAQLAQRAFAAVRAEKLRKGIPLSLPQDIARTGLIGRRWSPTTTVPGKLAAKQTSVNPNFAALFVQLLRRAGVRRGDVVAAGFSGSFPALNLAILAALQAMEVRPLVISSISASQWGANDPRFLWPAMEAAVLRRKIITTGSLAMEIGDVPGVDRRLTQQGRALLERTIVAHRVPLIRCQHEQQCVARRMALYRQHARGAPIKAYVNVGGSRTSVGGPDVKRAFRPGLNLRLPPAAESFESVMVKLARRGVPVIHVSRVVQLARRHGLPIKPQRTPRPGTGAVFVGCGGAVRRAAPRSGPR